MTLKYLLTLYFFFVVVYLEPMVKNANNYGTYKLRFDDYRGCKGPKTRNLTAMTTGMNAEKWLALINLTFFEDTRIDEIKVQVHNLKDNKKNFLWSYKLNDPCKHFAFAGIIKRELKTMNCLVKKGNYTCKVNFNEVIHAFLGESFFYGTYFYRSDLISKKGNIACFNNTLTFLKST